MILAASTNILSTMAVGGVLALTVILVVRKMWKKKKQTGTCFGCDCGCSGCPHAHSKED